MNESHPHSGLLAAPCSRTSHLHGQAVLFVSTLALTHVPLSCPTLLSLTMQRKATSRFDLFSLFHIFFFFSFYPHVDESHPIQRCNLNFVIRRASSAWRSSPCGTRCLTLAGRDARLKVKCVTVTNGIYLISILTSAAPPSAVRVERRALTLINVSHLISPSNCSVMSLM